LPAFGQHRGLKGSLPISGDLDLHLSDTLHGEAAGRGAVALSGPPFPAFIALPSQVEGQLPCHQGSERVTRHLSQVQAHQVTQLFRGFAHLLENSEDLRYSDFQLHGVFSSWWVLANCQFKGNTPFFIPLEISHNRFYTTFLQELGLPQADLVSELIDKILPKYKEPGGQVISPQEHGRHIDKILRALAVTSQDHRELDRERLDTALNETPFLNSVNNVTGIKAYKKPKEIYFRSPELELYFHGYQDAWLINENKGEMLWEKLGVASIPRFLEFDPQLSWQQKSALRRDYGYTRDWPPNDYRIDGLEHFLNYLNNYNEEQQKARSKYLWSFLVEFFREKSDWTKDRFFKGTYKWFYYTPGLCGKI
jgi:hypothetical protein